MTDLKNTPNDDVLKRAEERILKAHNEAEMCQIEGKSFMDLDASLIEELCNKLIEEEKKVINWHAKYTQCYKDKYEIIQELSDKLKAEQKASEGYKKLIERFY